MLLKILKMQRVECVLVCVLFISELLYKTNGFVVESEAKRAIEFYKTDSQRCKTDDQFQCDDSLCISGHNKCDGQEDCPDGSDEKNCTVIACPESKFLCKADSKCIDKKKLCDENRDCTDGADEIETCSAEECCNLSCSYGCRASFVGGECFCGSGRKLANDSRSCIEMNECKLWGFCDQFCNNTEGSYQCFCDEGYVWKETLQTCKANDTYPKMMLYFIYQDKILKIADETGAEAELVTNTTAAWGLDFHYDKNLIYWSDNTTKKIYSQKIVKNEEAQVEMTLSLPGTLTPGAIAIDFIANNIYVVDILGKKIDVFDLENNYHTIIMHLNVKDIALDPYVGYMFVVDSYNLIRANMDGSNIKLLRSDSFYTIHNVAIDTISKWVFWSDSYHHYIEKLNYDGTQRKVIVKGSPFNPIPNGLTIFERKIYWTDKKNLSVPIMSVDRFDANSIEAIYHLVGNSALPPKTIKAVHKVLQNNKNVTNPCEYSRANCSHMCLLTHTSQNELGSKCFCDIGYQLLSDNQQCTRIEEFLIYTHRKVIKSEVLDFTPYKYMDVINPIAADDVSFVGIDFDAREEYIYYSETNHDEIHRIRRNGSGHQALLKSSQENKISLENIALDWMSKNLYYVLSEKGRINVLMTENPENRKVLIQNLNHPRAIAVHPNKGFLYFSEWKNISGISRTNLDGTNLLKFNNAVVKWPNGLAIDYEMDRIYWCDANLDIVQSANLDGSEIKTIDTPKMRHPFSLAIHHEWLYISDWRINGIIRLDKNNESSNNIYLLNEQKTQVYGLRVYSIEEQVIEPDKFVCNSYTFCEAFCFPVPDNLTGVLFPQCGCPTGKILGTDEKTCLVDPNFELENSSSCDVLKYFACGNSRCILYLLVCDGKDDCQDDSDEETNYCTYVTCDANQFKCESGKCIANASRCDGNNDCYDASDEENCSVNPKEHFTCVNGRVIQKVLTCDNKDDCLDNSDELGCACKPNEFKCKSGECLSKAFTCDGRNDCSDSSDEKDCEADSNSEKNLTTCNSNKFTCDNGQCIHMKFNCDGQADCLDKSDERKCSLELCKPKTFKCKLEEKCIPSQFKCDGDKDCSDSSDEENCNFDCKSNSFKCDGIKCFPKMWKCDGDVDCQDGSDEQNCNTKKLT